MTERKLLNTIHLLHCPTEQTVIMRQLGIASHLLSGGNVYCIRLWSTEEYTRKGVGLEWRESQLVIAETRRQGAGAAAAAAVGMTEELE